MLNSLANLTDEIACWAFVTFVKARMIYPRWVSKDALSVWETWFLYTEASQVSRITARPSAAFSRDDFA